MVRSGNRHRPGRTGIRLPKSSHEATEQNRGKYSYYGSVRHKSNRAGQAIGAMDLLIAAHALALAATLVPNNVAHSHPGATRQADAVADSGGSRR
jgi:hypothetical protein